MGNLYLSIETFGDRSDVDSLVAGGMGLGGSVSLRE